MEKRQFFQVPGLFVYEDGTKFERVIKGQNGYPDKFTNPKIFVDSDGNKYIKVDHHNLRVDHLVARCFCHKEPWQNYVIHLDNDKANCHKNNLKWISLYEYYQYNTTNPKVVDASGKRNIGEDYFVSDKGEVEKSSQSLPIRDYIYDSDVDRHVPVNPFFDYHFVNRYGRTETKKKSVDEAVAKAFLPYPKDIKDPVLFHKDLNYRNNDASNLEWVEMDSLEYRDYINQMKSDKEKRQDELDAEFHF